LRSAYRNNNDDGNNNVGFRLASPPIESAPLLAANAGVQNVGAPVSTIQGQRQRDVHGCPWAQARFRRDAGPKSSSKDAGLRGS
jgi:hypothetical protein